MGMRTVAKVIEVVGTSDKSWQDAAEVAVKTASKTIKNITGVQVQQMSASVKKGEMTLYKTTVKVAFGLDD